MADAQGGRLVPDGSFPGPARRLAQSMGIEELDNTPGPTRRSRPRPTAPAHPLQRSLPPKRLSGGDPVRDMRQRFFDLVHQQQA